jgi:hypothetical protein
LKALQDLAARQGLDQNPPPARFSSLMGSCSNWTFSLQATEGEYLGGSAAGIDLFATAQIAGTTNPTGITSPAFPQYNNQVLYFLNNPSQMMGMRLQCPPDSTAIGFMQSLQKSIRSVTPQSGGYQLINSYNLAQVIALDQFQTNLLDDMSTMALSGYTYFNLSSPAPAPSTFSITMIILTDAPVRLIDQLPPAGAPYNRFPGAPAMGQTSGSRASGAQLVPTKR